MSCSPSKFLFIFTQLLSFFIGLVGLAAAYITFFTSFNDFDDFIPVELVQATAVFSGAVFFISLIGLTMVICKMDSCFLTFLIFSFGLMIINVGFFAIITRFNNGKSTIAPLDDLLNRTLLEFDANIQQIATDDPTGFKNVQNIIGCCGISIQVLFDLQKADDTISIDAIFSGDKCSEEIIINDETTTGLDFSLALINDNTDVADVIQAQNNQPEISEENFFCEKDLEDVVEDSLKLIQILVGLLMGFEFVSFVCAILIYHYVERDEEGNMDFDNAKEMNGYLVRVTKTVQKTVKKPFAKFSDSASYLGSHNNRRETLDEDDDMDGHLNPEFEEGKEGNARKVFKQKSKGEGIMSLIAPFRTSNKKLGKKKKGKEGEASVNEELDF